MLKYVYVYVYVDVYVQGRLWVWCPSLWIARGVSRVSLIGRQ